MKEYADKVVSIITNDGRNIIGKLIGCDPSVNVVLESSHERIYSIDSGVVMNQLGLYIIRGDNICIIGELDEEKDKEIDLSETRAGPIAPVIH